MATEYFISQINPETKDRYQPTDTNNSNVFEINSSVDLVKDKIETHFLDLDFNLIDSIYDSRNIQTSQDSEIAIDGKPSSIQLNPTDDAINNGFKDSSVIISYNFLKNLFSGTKLGGRFFIETISEDRTELRLLSTELSSEEIVEYSDSLIKEIESTSYFNDFRLNIGDNKLYIGVNIKTEDYREYKAVLVKLYQPLPDEVEEKTILTIEQKVADSVAYEVNAVFTPDVPKLPFLKGPNFIITEEESASPTSFLNYQELFDFPVNNSYRELNSLFKEKSINLSIDYSDFANFAHFSSVEERLRNFQYKLNLIEEYQVSSSQAAIARESGSTTFTSGSDLFWKGKLDGIINNFDHYDRHLYFGSGSTSWPKQDPQEKPYIQATGSATGSFVTEYFGTTVSSASVYDDSNANLLINTVPEYIRDDADSAQYSTFIHMLAQHFDNLYIYSKALSDKYDNDNRLDFGASKDLIQDLLKNFGVKIYNNVRSAESLFDIYSGQTYQTGSDVVTDLISASNTPISTENYRNDIHKRVYHNLPYLLKTKGTERGLKALIASFGIPTDNNIIGSGSNINGLYVRTFGGGTTGSFNAGPLTAYTSSLGKIRTDDTGSIVSGSTLSQYASIITRDKKYSDDIHSIEVGYSPTYELDEKIISASTTGFNIDNLIGDPRNAYSSSYAPLISHSEALIVPAVINSSSYDIIGDGFQVANVSLLNNLSGGDYEYRFQLSQSAQSPGSNPYNPNSDASDIPKASSSGFLKKAGGGFIAVTNTPSWGLVQGSTSTYLNAVTNSNTLTLTQPASGQIYPGGILRQEGDSTYSGSINGQTVTEVKLDGAASFKKHNVSFSDSDNNIIEFKVTGGPHTIPAGVEISISQTQWILETDSQIDDTVYTLSGSHNRTNMFGYTFTETLTSGSILSYPYKSHNYGELVRYLKYYDNVLFKMIKDFVPARANVDTGLIIKPHILERNKIKQVQGTFIEQQYTGSIDTAFTTGSDGSAFTNKLHQELTIPLTASYSESIVTSHVSGGLVTYHYHEKERTRYDGEFSGSHEFVYQHTLNDANDWKYVSPTNIFYKPIGVSKLACPTISLLSVTGSYSPDQFIYSGSFEASEAGVYYISYQPSDDISYAETLTPITVTEAGTNLWNTTSTSGFSALTPGTLFPTASMYHKVDGVASDCGTIRAPETMSFTIGAQPEVCPTITIDSAIATSTDYNGFNYNSSSYNNPTGIAIQISSSLITGSGIGHLGYMISTNPITNIEDNENAILLGVASSNGTANNLDLAYLSSGYFDSATHDSLLNNKSRFLEATHSWMDFGETYYIRAFARSTSTCGDSDSYIYSSQVIVTTPADARPTPTLLYFGQPVGNPPADTTCGYMVTGNTPGTSGSFYIWQTDADNNGFGINGTPLSLAIADKIFTSPISSSVNLAPVDYFYIESGSSEKRFFSASNEMLGNTVSCEF
jgi:hypothetical protein